jgi:hypothetical protein
LYQNLNQNCNNLYLEHLIYGLYVCTCVFLLRHESFNMVIVNNPSFYDGGVTIGAKFLDATIIRVAPECLDAGRLACLHRGTFYQKACF